MSYLRTRQQRGWAAFILGALLYLVGMSTLSASLRDDFWGEFLVSLALLGGIAVIVSLVVGGVFAALAWVRRGVDE